MKPLHPQSGRMIGFFICLLTAAFTIWMILLGTGQLAYHPWDRPGAIDSVLIGKR